MSEIFFVSTIPKPKKIRVSVSSSFPARARCKECGKFPDSYFWVPQRAAFYDPRSSNWVFDWYKKYLKRMAGDWYKKYQPRYFIKMKDFKATWLSRFSYKPTLHQHIGVEDPDATIVEYLECPCGKTVWAFAQKSAEFRLEIKHRKARYSYPQKFDSF